MSSNFARMGYGLLGVACLAAMGCSTPASSGPAPLVAAPSGFEPATLPGMRKDRVVEFDLTAGTARVNVDGKPVEVLAYNGAYPGPTLQLREGDQLVVHFKNTLSEPTSLHWHGKRTPVEQDDAMHVVAPGGTRDYTFDIPAGSAGTYWYHPHLHGSVASQVARGLFGAIRVTAADDPLPASVGDTVAVLSDLRVSSDGIAQAGTSAERANGFEGELLLVNGQREPSLTLRPGETRRLRLLNASASRYYQLSAGGQRMTLVGTDGGLIDKPVPIADLLLTPGERAEVLVTAPLQAGATVTIAAMPYDRGTMATTSSPPPGGHATDHGGHAMYTVAHAGHTSGEPLMKLQIAGEPASADLLPTTLRALPRLTGATASRELVFSEDHAAMDFRINGQKFDMNRVDMEAKLGATETWSVKNTGHMDHPFHLHGYQFQVLDRNGRAEPYLGWKDTVNVKPSETVRFSVKFDDHPGLRVFHCHILDHEDLGMMGIFRVSP